jgi:excisionase family DNA binding protein
MLLDIILRAAEATKLKTEVSAVGASNIRSRLAPSMPSQDEIFTIKELSEHLRVHPTTIYRLLRQGRLPGFRVGSNWRFNRAVIEQWERSQASDSPVPVARGRHKRR